ncbi:MAG TPA: hypothetical protein VGA37_15995 [Gemmatimonadales bacterium]
MSKRVEQVTDHEPPERAGAVDRRAFVKTAGGVVATIAFGTACGDDTPNGPNGDTGTLSVIISGLAGATAGSVTVTLPDSTDPGITVTLQDANSSGVSVGTATGVPVGTYRITYDPPAGHVITSGGDFQDVTVVANQAASAEFTVSASGTLEVEVTGIDASATTAGTVELTDTDGIPTGVAVPLPAPAAGESLASVSHPAGTVRVTVIPPPGHIHGGAAFQDIVVTAGGTVRASFAVQVVVQPGLIFASAWATALGTSNAARLDTDSATPWAAAGGNGDAEIIDATGRDFPTANCLRSAYEADATNTSVKAFSIAADGILHDSPFWPDLAVGGHLYHRAYLRNELPNYVAGFGANHPWNGETTWNWKFDNRNDGMFELIFNIQDKTVSPNVVANFACQTLLTKNTTYRLEHHVVRIADVGGEEHCNIDLRVYDAAGVLLFDNDDFRNQLGANELLSTVPALRFSVAQSSNMKIGCNGPGGSGWPGPSGNIFWAGVAASLADWCGPYVPGESA